MTARVAPNPHSPYADADPDARHLLPSLFGLALAPRGLALTGCGRMAVVPEEFLADLTDLLMAGRVGELPPGLCGDCIGFATGTASELPPVHGTCRKCGSGSSHGDLCALCRQEAHEAWWPTRGSQAAEQATASYRELLGSIWLYVNWRYVNWRYVTKQLTTEQKELWADAVNAAGDPEAPVSADKWWRE
ncbi:hypothetical protein ACGFJT_37335 [Actinomadura geliboluensis]|uniref:hypothetical protein n=1 Tax=Actinomadura geliboluensis TaxID=882440 RepID=UPI00370FF73C